ncbi:MAG TPA: GxxExxY protein [Kofleriaceae bacterium]|nr:GxxExxY protein [Kofleriaceae bacterium]
MFIVTSAPAVDALIPAYLAQVLSYLKSGVFQLGLLINFNVPALRLGIRRVIHS